MGPPSDALLSSPHHVVADRAQLCTARGAGTRDTGRMSEIRERDAMICRSCGKEERASEGYPCKDCGTFICLMCVFQGAVRCRMCEAAANGTLPVITSSRPPGDRNEH